MKESEIHPPETPSRKGSAFLADMRSHRKVFHRLAEFSRKLRRRSANFPKGLEKDLRSNENSPDESHTQDHLDEQMMPHLSILDENSMCQECGQNDHEHPTTIAMPQVSHPRCPTSRRTQLQCSSTAITMVKNSGNVESKILLVVLW